jgi:hypothetical protein
VVRLPDRVLPSRCLGRNLGNPVGLGWQGG